MESIYLKTFIEVVRTGSFTKTAETLCVTQSAISRRIQYMEKQYECSLLDRSGPLLKQTAKGQLLLDKALKIMEIEQELELGMNNSEGSNSLCFVSTPTFGTAYLPHVLSRFVRAVPKVKNLKLFLDMPDGIRGSLRRGIFEIAVIEHCPDFDLSEFETVPLKTDEMVLATATNAQLSCTSPQAEELLGHTFLSCGAGCCTRILMERNMQSKGFSMEQFKRVIEIADLDTLIQSLLAGVGIAFIPSALISPFVDSGQLKAYKVEDFIHHRNRSLVVPQHAVSRSLNSLFAEQIIAYFEEESSLAE